MCYLIKSFLEIKVDNISLNIIIKGVVDIVVKLNAPYQNQIGKGIRIKLFVNKALKHFRDGTEK